MKASTRRAWGETTRFTCCKKTRFSLKSRPNWTWIRPLTSSSSKITSWCQTYQSWAKSRLCHLGWKVNPWCILRGASSRRSRPRNNLDTTSSVARKFIRNPKTKVQFPARRLWKKNYRLSTTDRRRKSPGSSACLLTMMMMIRPRQTGLHNLRVNAPGPLRNSKKERRAPATLGAFQGKMRLARSMWLLCD